MRAIAHARVGTSLAISTLLWCLPLGGEAPADQPGKSAGETLATFEARDVIGFDWPRTLVTYRVEFRPGRAFPRTVRLVDEDSREQPCQLSRLSKHRDGSMA